MSRRQLVAGVFVGGASSRMGGRPKGLLVPPDGGATIVARTRSLFERAGACVVTVGGEGAVVADDPPGIGPLGGLLALLRHAEAGVVVAVACDMPFVTDALVSRLVSFPPAVAVAPRRDGRWEPLFARFDAAAARPIASAWAASGRRSLQGLMDSLGAVELPLSPAEETLLDDWDTPDDVTRPR